MTLAAWQQQCKPHETGCSEFDPVFKWAVDGFIERVCLAGRPGRPKLHISSHFLMCSSVTWSSWNCGRCDLGDWERGWRWVAEQMQLWWSIMIYLCMWHVKTIDLVYDLSMLCIQCHQAWAISGCPVTLPAFSIPYKMFSRTVLLKRMGSCPTNPILDWWGRHMPHKKKHGGKANGRTAKWLKGKKQKGWRWPICLWHALI